MFSFLQVHCTQNDTVLVSSDSDSESNAHAYFGDALDDLFSGDLSETNLNPPALPQQQQLGYIFEQDEENDGRRCKVLADDQFKDMRGGGATDLFTSGIEHAISGGQEVGDTSGDQGAISGGDANPDDGTETRSNRNMSETPKDGGGSKKGGSPRAKNSGGSNKSSPGRSANSSGATGSSASKLSTGNDVRGTNESRGMNGSNKASPTQHNKVGDFSAGRSNAAKRLFGEEGDKARHKDERKKLKFIKSKSGDEAPQSIDTDSGTDTQNTKNNGSDKTPNKKSASKSSPIVKKSNTSNPLSPQQRQRTPTRRKAEFDASQKLSEDATGKFFKSSKLASKHSPSKISPQKSPKISPEKSPRSASSSANKIASRNSPTTRKRKIQKAAEMATKKKKSKSCRMLNELKSSAGKSGQVQSRRKLQRPRQ